MMMNILMRLQKHNIIGHKLARILQSYEVHDGWIHFTRHYFVLESGIAFTFPFDVESDFAATSIPEGAEGIVHPALHEAIGATIEGVYRPKNDDEFFEPDAILLHLDSGLWVWQLSSAPQGVHDSVGVYIDRSAPEVDTEMVDYWSEKEA